MAIERRMIMTIRIMIPIIEEYVVISIAHRPGTENPAVPRGYLPEYICMVIESSCPESGLNLSPALRGNW
jgi:hypothetical protein